MILSGVDRGCLHEQTKRGWHELRFEISRMQAHEKSIRHPIVYIVSSEQNSFVST